MTPLEAWQLLDLRAARVLEALPFPEARRPAWRLRLDVGELGEMWSSAQITDLYRAEDLTGRMVITAVNLGGRQIGPFTSECLVIGAPDEEGRVILASMERPVPPGSRIF
jgi:tRNA-binding protein